MTIDETRLRLVAASTWLSYGLEGRVTLPEAIAGCRKLLDAAERMLGEDAAAWHESVR